jgi:mono/diheme cytochrome c family protein
MNRRILAVAALAAIWGMSVCGCSKKEQPEKTEVQQAPPAEQTAPAPVESANSGEALFKKHCAVCHADGGNIINAKKTLHSKALAASNITKPADIVKVMRNPGPGMTRFDEATLSAKDADAIAEYVLKTFKE